jgi:tetratricopeptide (TPR) repeat protein
MEGVFFIAMEYVEGQDLAELMRRGPLATGFATDVAISVARALEHAHGLDVTLDGRGFRGIVHGDIKPKNIRISNRGEVRILDFGIAKALALSRKLTRNEFGSVPYASPERLESGQVDAQSDLWSLAVMLYEMVSGHQPYEAETTERLERMIRSHIPPPPAPEPCPEPVRRVLMKAMAPEVSMRYGSARELAEELETFKAGGAVRAAAEDLEATRRTFRRDFGADGSETRRSAEPKPAKPMTWPFRKQGSGKRMSSAVLVLAVLAGACVLFGLWNGISHYRLYGEGKALERDIQSERISDPDEIWTKWTELSKSNPSSFLLSGPRGVVRAKLIAAADHVIMLFGNGQPQPLKDWEHAKTQLAEALALDPDDQVRGQLRLCEGHVLRISGMYLNDQKSLVTAVEKFNESAQLLPKSPDPYLGLAQLYLSGIKDLDKAYDCLREAGKRGHPLGAREKQLIADAYLEQGDELFNGSHDVHGTPQEKDQLDRAEEAYSRALELYQGIAPYGHASRGAARAQSSIDGVTVRLGEIAKGGNLPFFR